MTLKEAHTRARDAIKSMLMNEFFRENFYEIRERDAETFANEILSKIRAEFHAAGFVMAPEVATDEMVDAAWAEALDENAEGVWRKMLAASHKIDEEG